MSARIVTFTIAAEEYGLPVSCVREVIRFIRARPLPTTSPAVCGVIKLRDQRQYWRSLT